MKTVKFYFIITLLCICFFEKINGQEIASCDSVIKLMTKVADWQLNTWDKKGMKWTMWDWTNSTAYVGYLAFNDIAKNPKYSNFLYNVGEGCQWNTGPRRLMADDYCIGQVYAQLYHIYKDPKMIAHFKAQADTIASLPHNESLEWKNNVQLREWAWCDALFMAPPALAYLSSVTCETKYLDIADKLWWKTTDYLFDHEENLYFRDSKYFNKKEPNGNKMFWARGNGWVMGGLVRMLKNIPKDYHDRKKYVELFTKMAAKIATLQNADGTWHTGLLDSTTYTAKETSGTGFYCYALAWGINNSLLSKDKYMPVVSKAWDALSNAVHPDGKLGNVQQIGEKPGAVDYESTEVYGVGAFLLAGSEVIKLK